MYSKELTAPTVWGVEVPSWLRVFDCRQDDPFLGPKAPWGAMLWSGERAEVDLGLRGQDAEGKLFSHATTPHSCSTYIDARKTNEQELRRQLSDAVAQAKQLYQEYITAKGKTDARDEGKGGSCLYLPVAVEISNYGWGIISDQRTMVVRPFNSK